MDTRKRTFGWGDAIAVFVIAVLVVFVIYPVYRALHPDNRTRGVLVDENFRPIAGEVLVARDRAGRTLGTATTDTRGEVLWDRAWRIPGTTFGKYGVARFAPSTGGRARIYLAPLVLHRVRVRNAATGLPQPDLTVHANLDARTRSSIPDFRETVGETSASGAFDIGLLPSTARMTFYSENASLAVWNVAPKNVRRTGTPQQMEILYDVTVVPTGTLAGRAIYPDGTPVTRGLVFATRTDAPLNDDNRYQRVTIDPATKRFRMRGLLPGRWRIGFQPNYRAKEQSGGGREVLIQSGETKTLGEPLRVYWTNDKP